MGYPKPEFLTPTPDQIERLRSDFFDRLNRDGAPCEGGFHLKDIERIKTTDIWLQRFLEQQDLHADASLEMLWSTCKWRKEFGANDLSVSSLNQSYLDAGLSFPRNRDIDGKTILVLKSKLHIRGARDNEQLFRIFIYWIERLNREENYETISLFFDLAGTGLKNLDLDYTKHIVNTLKQYYPNALNYIFVFELPWILTAAFNIIKALFPPKAVAALRFVNMKNLGDYITEENMLTCWGGKDDYEFTFLPESNEPARDIQSTPKESIMQKDENDNTTHPNSNKKVNFANTLSVNEFPMTEQNVGFAGKKSEIRDGTMLKIAPAEIITFLKVENELVGTVDIQNIVKFPITFKIKTTSPEKFRVRPSTGKLMPGCSTTISVVLQSGPNVTLLLNRDKFLVMCMEMRDLNATPEDIAEIWKNTQNNSQSVEQHRLKCNIGKINSTGTSNVVGDMAKSSSTLLNNGGVIDSDRQWLQVSYSVSQLMDTTRRLEARVKFNQKLQWFTVLVFLLLSIAVVYILKSEINNNNSSDHCSSSSGRSNNIYSNDHYN